MSFNLIDNDNQFQLGTVFEIPKKEEYTRVRFNEILIQKTKSDISYNNNCLRFLRKGVDYLNKPLKYIYEGNYDEYNYYYLLNQIFIPPYINYNNVNDYCMQINKSIEDSIINSSIDTGINMYLYSKSVLEPVYSNENTSKKMIKRTGSIDDHVDFNPSTSNDGVDDGNTDSFFDKTKTEIGITLYKQTTSGPVTLTFFSFENDNYNLGTLLSTNFNYYTTDGTKQLFCSGICFFDLSNPIKIQQNFLFQFNNYTNSKFEALYTLSKSNTLYTETEFLNNDSINVYNLNSQYTTIFYPPNTPNNFEYLISRCRFIVYEIKLADNKKYYASLYNNFNDIINNENYLTVHLKCYDTYPANIDGPFTFNKNVDSIKIKDTTTNYVYSLDEQVEIQQNLDNTSEVTFDFTSLSSKFTNLLYEPKENTDNTNVDKIIPDDVVIERYNLKYIYSMVTDYYTNTTINNLNKNIENVNIRLKFENKYEYQNENNSYSRYKKIEKILNKNKKYNINGVAGNFVYKISGTNEIVTQSQIIQNQYYTSVFNPNITGNLSLASFDIVIWINPTSDRINDYKVITNSEDGSQKYMYYLQEGDQLLCIPNKNNLETQIIIELSNFNTASTSDGNIIYPSYLEFEFIPIFDKNSSIMANNNYTNNDGIWFLNFQITFTNSFGNRYTDELDVLIDDLSEYIESLNGNTVIKFKNKDIEIITDITSLIYKINEIPFIPNSDIYYGSTMYFDSTSEIVKYQTNNKNNMLIMSQYILTGFILNVTSITSNNEMKTIDYKNNIIRYKHWYNKNNEAIFDQETYYMLGDLTYEFVKTKEIFTSNNTNTYIQALYQNNPIINKLPNLKIQQLKIHKLIEDEFFFNYFKHKSFITYVDNLLKFNIDIIPIEFVEDINNKSLCNISNVNEMKNGIDIKTTLNLMPTMFNRAKKRELNLNNNVSKYLDVLNRTNKFYSLFGQFSKNLWHKIGIIPNKLNHNLLLHEYDSKQFRCYNFIGSNMTQEIYNHNDLDLNTNIFEHKIKLKIENNLYNPTKKYVYDSIIQNYTDFNEMISELEFVLPKKDFKLYEHGKYIIDNTFKLNIIPNINFDSEQYNIKMSYSKNVDDIINNTLNSKEIEKNIIKTQNYDNYYLFDLTHDNIIYTFDNENSIYLYIDSQYHYPFLSGTNAILKVEYM